MTLSRALIADVHQRLRDERLALRRMLVNVTTAEATVWRGWRVCLRRQHNLTGDWPHYDGYFAVVWSGGAWTSPHWHEAYHMTRRHSARLRREYAAAQLATVNHLLTLPEREPDSCPRCERVLTLDNKFAVFCCYECQRDYGNAKRRMKISAR